MKKADTDSSAAPGPVDLPTNVSTLEQLDTLPREYKSGDPSRPLQHIDEDTGEVFTYALNPIAFSVVFILSIELLERFSYYGLVYTQTSFLTGVYSDWSAEMTAVSASSYVSIGVAMAYSTPFLGAILSDTLLGDYRSILVGCLCFYIPGLLLIDLTTVPYLLGEEFNTNAFVFALLVLWPIGTGTLKSVINVFGARQHHPILQSSLIESFYVSFYMVINVGSLVGGLLIPIVAQYNITIAYFIPLLMLTAGLICFLVGSHRYVVARPRGSIWSALLSDTNKRSTALEGNNTSLWSIFKVCTLIIPFNIVYNQQATMFIVQGTVMKKAFGVFDAASMNNADSCAVLLFGFLIGQKLYPWLATKSIKLATTHKFAIGCGLGALALLWSLFVEYRIHSVYEETREPISILWQVPSYMLIGMGEIFAISTAYETAFTIAPAQKKALASATNIFCVGGIPNVLCLFLYHACSPWFRNAAGTAKLHTLKTYSEAQIGKYFALLVVIALSGIAINLVPSVTDFVSKLEQVASSAIKTPRMTPIPRHRKDAETEATALLREKRTHDYVYSKPASFLAGPALRKDNEVVKKDMEKNRKGYLLRHALKRASSLVGKK